MSKPIPKQGEEVTHKGHELSFGVINNVAETDIFCKTCSKAQGQFVFLTGQAAINLGLGLSRRGLA